MLKNMGGLDRKVRGAAAVVLLVLSLVTGLDSVAGVILLVLAVIMGVTAAVGLCPLYKPFGISTCPVKR